MYFVSAVNNCERLENKVRGLKFNLDYKRITKVEVKHCVAEIYNQTLTFLLLGQL